MTGTLRVHANTFSSTCTLFTIRGIFFFPNSRFPPACALLYIRIVPDIITVAISISGLSSTDTGGRPDNVHGRLIRFLRRKRAFEAFRPSARCDGRFNYYVFALRITDKKDRLTRPSPCLITSRRDEQGGKATRFLFCFRPNENCGANKRRAAELFAENAPVRRLAVYA